MYNVMQWYMILRQTHSLSQPESIDWFETQTTVQYILIHKTLYVLIRDERTHRECHRHAALCFADYAMCSTLVRSRLQWCKLTGGLRLRFAARVAQRRKQKGKVCFVCFTGVFMQNHLNCYLHVHKINIIIY